MKKAGKPEKKNRSKKESGTKQIVTGRGRSSRTRETSRRAGWRGEFCNAARTGK